MIIGHQKQWQFLRKSVETERLSHAYLFSGQSHLGKKTLAKEFVKLLNCQETFRHFSGSPSGQTNFAKSNGGCQKCWSCRAFQREVHPDLVVIKPQNKEIKIVQIRELQRLLSFRPHSSVFKAVIIEKAERMNQESQNCLLKTLEEPLGNTLLFLITGHPRMLFSTVLSRVQEVRFFPVPKIEIENYLKEQKIVLSKIEQIISFSFGRPGLAIEFSQNIQKLEQESQRIKEIAKIIQQSLPLRFQYVKDLTSRERDLKETLEVWLRYFRDVSRLKMGLPSELRILSSSVPDLSLSQLKRIINSIEKVNFLVSSTNVNNKLALETLMLQF